MIAATILESGDLRLTLEPETDADELRENLNARGFWWTMAEAFEQYEANGGFAPFDAGEANPFVGLTSAPCIAESLDTDDDGARTIDGRFWYFGDYAIRCPIEDILSHGESIWTLAPVVNLKES